MRGGEKMSAIQVIHEHRWEAGPQNAAWRSPTRMTFRVPAPLPDFAHPSSGSLLRTSTQTHLIPFSAFAASSAPPPRRRR